MQNHYNYVFDDVAGTYKFTTNNNIIYQVAFVVDETFSVVSGEEISNVFQLVIEKESDEIEPFDPKVSKTIGNIVGRFFEKVENSLVYVCYDEDKKGETRHQVFDKWYRESDYRKSIVKIDNIIKVNITQHECHKLYTSFLFHKENSDHEKLIEIYNQIEQILNGEK